MAMMQVIIEQKTKGDIKASKARWDEFTEEAIKRSGSIAHKVIKKTRAEPAAALDADPEKPAALAGQAALDKALDDWLPLWANPDRAGRRLHGHDAGHRRAEDPG